MTKFKEGDWVRALPDNGWVDAGAVGRVAEDDAIPFVDWLSHTRLAVLERNLEPWAPRVGEKVRALVDDIDITKGKEYEVVDISNAGAAVIDDAGDRWRLYFDNVEPVVGSAVEKPKFKVGDRVTVSGHPYTFGAGQNQGVIVGLAVKKRAKWDIKIDDYYGAPLSFQETEMEIADPTPLKIEAGKCYRTRDGKKVGPILDLHGNLIEKVGDGRLWRVDGTGLNKASSESLVAEWVDEPDAAASVPKFKVGDRVVSKFTEEAGVGVIENVNADGSYSINFKDTWYAFCQEVESDIELAAPTTPTTGTAIVCLIKDGKPAPAETPHVHENGYSALTEARRMAGIHKGETFGVYELRDTVRDGVPDDCADKTGKVARAADVGHGMTQTYRNITARDGEKSAINGKVFTLQEECANDFYNDVLPNIPAGTSIVADFAGDFGIYGMAEVDGTLHKIKIRLHELHKINFGEFDARAA